MLLGGLKRRGAALVVNHTGIVDNATEYVLGQIAWAEIEKMYPSVLATPLLTNWWKMPTVDRQRGVVVVLKDGVDFHSRTGRRARFVKSALNTRFGPDKSRWLFIPEMLLATTAGDVIRRLNEFYVTQVTKPLSDEGVLS